MWNMVRLRILAWLLTFAALIAPPGWSKAVSAMAGDPAVAMDCAEHAPPPSCPDEGTAKHATATCCPATGGAFSLAAAEPLPVPAVRPVVPTARLMPMLRGHVPAADLPPPRN